MKWIELSYNAEVTHIYISSLINVSCILWTRGHLGAILEGTFWATEPSDNVFWRRIYGGHPAWYGDS